MKETPLDSFLNKVFTGVVILGGLGAIAYFYLKDKYKDKSEDILKILK